MIKLEFSPESRKDLLEIALYIAQENPNAAFSFVDELEASCKKLEDFPHIGAERPELGKNIRALVHESYLIFYEASETCARIERILHGSRDLSAVLDQKKNQQRRKRSSFIKHKTDAD